MKRRHRRAPDSPDYADRVITIELLEQQVKVLETLSSRERGIFINLAGWDDDEVLTPDELARYYGVPVAHIRKIRDKVADRLYHPSRSQVLRDYLDTNFMTIPDHIRKRIMSDKPVQIGIVRTRCPRHGETFLPRRHERTCETCPCLISDLVRGRRRRFCSAACRQAAYRRRSSTSDAPRVTPGFSPKARDSPNTGD
jgi:hypothetical protein